jgi:hypothetical protein
MPTVEIRYEAGECPATFDLTDILASVEPFVDGLTWYFVEFDPVLLLGADGTPNTVPPSWVSSLWREIEKGESHVKVEWQTLREFARHVAQTNMALLVGLDSSQELPPEPLDLNSPHLAIVIQALDAHMWAITTRSAQLIKAIKAQFQKAKIVEKTQRYY